MRCDRLYRPRSASLDAVAWTAGDAALVDEARAVLGPRRGRPVRARSARPEEGSSNEGGFGRPGSPLRPPPRREEGPHSVRRRWPRRRSRLGHIVVDEVQDLSPMQLRMLARPAPLSGSMTVVGDIAQATGPWAPTGWDDVIRHLSPQRAPRLVGADRELPHARRGGRGRPAQVLAVAAPSVRPPRPVRESGWPPRIVRTAWVSLAATAAEQAREEVAAVAPGRVAVLGAAAILPELTRALADAGLDPVDPRDPGGPGLAAGLVVLPADEANGLEFDSVVVVEPSLVAAVGGDTSGEAPPVVTTRGLRALYVARRHPADPTPRHRPRWSAPGGTALTWDSGSVDVLTSLLAPRTSRELEVGGHRPVARPAWRRGRGSSAPGPGGRDRYGSSGSRGSPTVSSSPDRGDAAVDRDDRAVR